MKKFVRCALLFSFVILLCTSCGKGEPNELLQTEHIPGTEEAVVHTATPSPTVLPSLTATQTPEITEPGDAKTTPSPVPATLPPLPTLSLEEPEFMKLYRAMPAGVRIDTEGISEEEIRFCFCDMEITNQTRTAFSDQESLIWTDVQSLKRVRVLYYRNDSKPYICDVVADADECEAIVRTFYQMYQNEIRIEDLMHSLPDELSSQGYQMGTLSAGSVQYLYLYRYIYK